MAEEQLYIVFFDGVCNLCNRTVQFIIKRDKRGQIQFASLQSDYAQKLLPSKYSKELSSIIVYDNGALLKESDAILSIVKQIGPLYSWMQMFRIFPKFIRDGVYKWISKNRYKWFGRQDSCMIPTPELKARFID